MVLRKSPSHERLTVHYLSPTSIAPNPKNARRHPAKQITKLTATIREHGFNVPIVIDEAGVILAGHGRYEAALQLKLDQVPCIRLTHLSRAQKTAFAIADNKIGDLSAFDGDALRAQLDELLQLDFNMELTGFETAEIDVIFDSVTAKTSTDPDDAFDEPDPQQVAVSQRGDVWDLGNHRLLCGNALEPADYQKLLGDRRAQLVFTDVPYNVPISGHVSGLGRIKHREFAMASGEMSDSEYDAFLTTAMTNMATFCTDGSIHYHCIDGKHVHALLTAGARAYTEFKAMCVWVKPNAGMGSLYRHQHEAGSGLQEGYRATCKQCPTRQARAA